MKKDSYLGNGEMSGLKKDVAKFLKHVYGGVTGTGRRLGDKEQIPVLLGKIPREKGLPFFCTAVGPDFVHEWLPDRVTINFFKMYQSEDKARPFVIDAVQAFNVSKETFKTFWNEWSSDQISVYPTITKQNMAIRVYPRNGGAQISLSVHLTPADAPTADKLRPARVQRNMITFPGYPDAVACSTYLIRDGEIPQQTQNSAPRYMSAPMPIVDPEKKVKDLRPDELLTLCYDLLKGYEGDMRAEKHETGAEAIRQFRKFRREGDTTFTITLKAKSDWRAYGK